LFGSVTNHDLAEAISVSGVAVSKTEIRLPQGPLKAIGEYTIDVALHHDVIVNVAIVVQGE